MNPDRGSVSLGAGRSALVLLLLSLIVIMEWTKCGIGSAPMPDGAETLDRINSIVRETLEEVPPQTELRCEDLEVAKSYVFAHPDRSAYRILMSIRELNLAAYCSIPKVVRAKVFCNKLIASDSFDEIGGLDEALPLGEGGLALLEVGHEARPTLVELLEDESKLGAEDGEMNAWYREIKARKKDWAYRFLCFIEDIRPQFDRDPAVRDRWIQELRNRFR